MANALRLTLPSLLAVAPCVGCSSSSPATSTSFPATTDAGGALMDVGAMGSDAQSGDDTSLAVGSDAGASTATDAGSSDSAAGGDDGSVTAASVAEASIDSIPLPAGVETTVCITKRLTNPVDTTISGFSATLGPGSHHLIVYRTTATQENLTPTPCSPFAGLTDGTAEPIVLINRVQVDWMFPAGVALDVPANQMVRIEAHYINAGKTDLVGSGRVAFQGYPKASAPTHLQAGFLFWGTSKIQIPANSNFTAGPNFQNGIPFTHMVSIMTHQHELGTGIHAWASAQSGDTSNQIAFDPDWSNPSWRLLSPQVDFNGANGLTYECSWYNSTSSAVSYGESALDEMCFVGGYYYPTHGFDLCVDGICSLAFEGLR